MEYRLDKHALLSIMEQWNRYLRRKVHLIACGGTAMTLMGIKSSTKDVDFMVPNIGEHDYLTKRLRMLGYKAITGSGWKRSGELFEFDLFRGNSIHTTGLLVSPLEEGRHMVYREYEYLFIGILNEYDLVSSKLMRGTSVDFEDCLDVVKARNSIVDIDRLVEHFREMVSYDVMEERLKNNMDYFISLLRARGLYE